MADPYSVNPHHSHSIESEDMSSFVHNLLHGSSASAAAAHGGGLFARSTTGTSNLESRMREGSSAAVVEPSSSLNLSDPCGFYGAQVKEDAVNTFSLAGIGDREAITSSKEIEFANDNKVEEFAFTLEDCETSDAPSNQAQRGRSSKRSRSAEVHNLSEKRRRSRINEKLKALQNLIPNSNKTDKASMLDEAIEYLKQLQLQVQMLTMRNGLNLYPGYFQGSLQSIQLPPSGSGFDENVILNTRGTSFSGNQEISLHTAFEISHQNSSAQQNASSMKNNANPESPLVFEAPLQNHYGMHNHLASTKDICRNDTLARLHLDMSRSGNSSSPGVSS